ncbi:MAG: hypothetical protein ABIH26_14865 [Candidatus Eisenbacteria bacterium]
MVDRADGLSGERAGPRGSVTRLGRLLPHGIALAGAVVAAFLLYHEVLGYALVGHDTYPIIAAARIRDAGDLLGTFTEELMDGRYTEGHFYRPVLNLSFAIDHALYGLRAWGYHLTDLLLLALTAYAIARLASGGGRRAIGIAGIAAGLLYLFHPVHLNVLPVAARRADSLAVLFVALALLAGRARGRSGRWGPALFALLAVGSKESGAIAPVLLFAQALLSSRGDRSREPRRLRSALREAILPLAAVLLFFLARQAVLGGLGGHREVSFAGLSRHAVLIFMWIQRYTFHPYPILGGLLGGQAWTPALFAFYAIASAALLRGTGAGRTAALAWAWLLLGAGIHIPSLSISPWYALHSVAGLAILSGLLVERVLAVAADEGRGGARIGGAFVLAAVVALGGVNLRHSPLFAFYPEWKDASRKTERFLGGLKARVRSAPAESTIEAPDLPFLSRYRSGSPIAIVAPLSDYAVQAWAELTFPERRIRVARAGTEAAPPAADEVLVVVAPGG